MSLRDFPHRIDSYPISVNSLRDDFGDEVVETTRGELAISDVIHDWNNSHTFESPMELLTAFDADLLQPLRLRDVPAFVATYVSFPVERATIVDVFGDIRIETPTDSDEETVRETIERCSEEDGAVYIDTMDLCDTLFCNVSEEHIGRKYYDDRGDNVGDSVEHVSF